MDSTILVFLAAPIAASLIIAGIHAYLGLHVVERGVIFVDLSLAQIASLGELKRSIQQSFDTLRTAAMDAHARLPARSARAKLRLIPRARDEQGRVPLSRPQHSEGGGNR